MEESINPTITLGPVSFNLTLLAMTLISVFAVFGFIYWASRKMSIRPKGKQNVLEYAYDFVVRLHQRKYWGTLHKGLFLVLVCSFPLSFSSQ